MQWQFDLDGVEIDEPIGFSDIALRIGRDDYWHGIFFEASTSQLGFYGEAYTILKNAKESYGVDAVVIFTAKGKCDGESEFEEVISGKLIGYSETCGTECILRASVERNNCNMIFKNRFDQKVDMESSVAFDKITNLANYSGLDFSMELAAQDIPISADAQVSEDGDGTQIGPFQMDLIETVLIRPAYERVNDNSILTGQLNDAMSLFEDPEQTFMLSPQVFLEENGTCINTEFEYEIRLKGAIRMDRVFVISDSVVQLALVVDTWDGIGTHIGNRTLLHVDIITADAVDGFGYVFDETYTGTVTIPEGVGVYAYLEASYQSGAGGLNSFNFDYDFDPETSFYLSNTKSCPPTNAEVNLVHETLARLTEAITDRCLTIKSEYYGRTDSEPQAYSADGCGSLRVVTPGLKIRQATDKNFFASMKEVMEGLRAIDNIGMGPEGEFIRIEPARYFYQDEKILTIDLIPESRHDIDETKVYSNIKAGYSKWEIKSVKGIDEFNSAKEFRTGIKSVSNELNIQSNLITSGYIIESLRTSTLVNTGNTDSTYDNDIFLICVTRAGYGYNVEQGVTENAANFFSPATAYNWRVRPLYNLMRWFKSIAQSYVSLSSTASKLFFAEGKGNYLAEGELSPYDICRLESRVLPENHDLAANDFQDATDATPIYKPETVEFEYPLSIADYKTLTANPYGYLSVQCGQGPFIKAYIKNIEYKPAAGTAKFQLIKAWH